MRKLCLATLFVLALAVSGRAQVVPWSDVVLTSRGTPAGGASVAVCANPGLATTGATVTSNIAILTMSSNPVTAGFVANMSLSVAGFTGADTYFNGSFTILTVTSTTITYALTHANASASSNGTAFQTGNSATSCAPLSSIFSDAGGLVPITQPGFTADGLGNYAFYAATGNYNIQFYGPVLTVRVKPVNLPCAGSCSFSSLTVSGAATLNGGSTLGGTVSVPGNMTATGGQNQIIAYNTNKTYVVDGSHYATIQNAIDAAAAASPPGGKVFLPCGSYSTATNIMPPYPAIIHLSGDAEQCVVLIPNAANIPLFEASTGTVNTQNASSGGCSSNCVTYATGTNFQKFVAGDSININGTVYGVGTVVSNTLLSLTSAPGTQSGVFYDRLGASPIATGLVESDTFDNFTIQANSGSNTDAAGGAFLLSGFRNTNIDHVEYRSDPGATNTVGNYTQVFDHSAFPGLEYGTHISHFKMSNLAFTPRRVDYCENGGTTNSVNNSNEDYFTNFWIYGQGKGPNTIFEHRRCAQYVVRDGLSEINPGYSSTVSTQNAATGGCAGNCVTQTAGDQFNTSLLAGDPIQINSVTYIISSVQSGTLLTLTTAPGTQTGVAAKFGGVVIDPGTNNIYEGTWSEANGFQQFWLQSASDGAASGTKIQNNYQTTPQNVQINSGVQDVLLIGNTPDNVGVTDNSGGGTNNTKFFGSTFTCYNSDCALKMINGTATGKDWEWWSSNGVGALGINGGFALRDAANSKFAFTVTPSTEAFNWTGPQTYSATSSINFTSLLVSPTAPTIAAAGCGGAAASIVVSNGTAAFKVNVGTTPGSACTLTLPAATTGWNCFATDITTNSTSVFVQKQTGAESTTSVVITNFNDVAVATAFVASDILKMSCHAD